MKIRINVTQRDIEHGEIDCAQRPVAIAIRRRVRDNVELLVHKNIVQLLLFVLNLPPIAQKFIARFDTREPVTPFRFTLDIPSKYLRNQPAAV